MKNSEGFFISSDFLAAILDKAPFGIIALTQNGTIQLINHQAIDFLGIETSTHAIQNNAILDVLDIPAKLKERISVRLLGERKKFDIEGHFHNNRYLTYRGRITSEGSIITIADITSIKMSEFVALKSMLEGQEIERKRIAREIHDGIGPLLSALKLKLANIEGNIEKNENIRIDLFKSYELIDEAADDLRSISHNLLPKVLLDFGLIEALETLADRIQNTKNVGMTFIFTGVPQRFDQVFELGLYRVCQELINNTLKHASAKAITLQLIKLENMLHLIYEDNGLGFEPADCIQGIGLMNIEYRIKALGGEVNIDSLPGKGMTATIEVPLNPPANVTD